MNVLFYYIAALASCAIKLNKQNEIFVATILQALADIAARSYLYFIAHETISTIKYVYT